MPDKQFPISLVMKHHFFFWPFCICCGFFCFSLMSVRVGFPFHVPLLFELVSDTRACTCCNASMFWYLAVCHSNVISWCSCDINFRMWFSCHQCMLLCLIQAPLSGCLLVRFLFLFQYLSWTCALECWLMAWQPRVLHVAGCLLLRMCLRDGGARVGGTARQLHHKVVWDGQWEVHAGQRLARLIGSARQTDGVVCCPWCFFWSGLLGECPVQGTSFLAFRACCWLVTQSVHVYVPVWALAVVIHVAFWQGVPHRAHFASIWLQQQQHDLLCLLFLVSLGRRWVVL